MIAILLEEEPISRLVYYIDIAISVPLLHIVYNIY